MLVRPPAGGSSRLAWRNVEKQPFVLLAPPGASGDSPADQLRRFDLIQYAPALTGGRLAARHARKLCPDARRIMEIRSIDAIVGMVSAGLGVSIVPRPRAAHGVREVSLGKAGPVRRIAFVQRRNDLGNRNLEAVFRALAGT